MESSITNTLSQFIFSQKPKILFRNIFVWCYRWLPPLPFLGQLDWRNIKQNENLWNQSPYPCWKGIVVLYYQASYFSISVLFFERHDFTLPTKFGDPQIHSCYWWNFEQCLGSLTSSSSCKHELKLPVFSFTFANLYFSNLYIISLLIVKLFIKWQILAKFVMCKVLTLRTVKQWLDLWSISSLGVLHKRSNMWKRVRVKER